MEIKKQRQIARLFQRLLPKSQRTNESIFKGILSEEEREDER